MEGAFRGGLRAFTYSTSKSFLFDFSLFISVEQPFVKTRVISYLQGRFGPEREGHHGGNKGDPFWPRHHRRCTSHRSRFC